MTIKPVAWRWKFKDSDAWGGASIDEPSKTQAAVFDIDPLCRHDEAMAEIERLTKERDAAFAMSRCECGTDEACANLVAKDKEIERLRAENAKLTVACATYEAEAAGLREQLAGSDENTLLRHLAYIRQKAGVGMKPMLSELADAIAEKIKGERDKALEDAATIVDAVSHEGLHESMWRNNFARVSAAIRALKENKNEN